MNNQTQETIGNEQIIIPQQERQLEPLAKAGLIISLVFASLTILGSFGLFVETIAGGFFLLLWAIGVLVIDILALKQKTYSLVLAAGIISTLFTSIIGGILILCGLPKKG